MNYFVLLAKGSQTSLLGNPESYTAMLKNGLIFHT